jgi:fatty acid desaturase
LQFYSDLYQVEEFKLRLLKKSKYKSLKKDKMGNLLYTIAVILVIFWAIGFFAFSLGSIIHVLLVIAVIAILFRLIQGRGI